MAGGRVSRVVVMIQENHTTDNYLGGLRPYGVNVATGWPVQPNPPARDQPHDRAAYARWLADPATATHTQFDTLGVLDYYAYLALSGALLENHCAGFGTNSTPNHLLLVGGQSPTLRNPPRGTQPVWDLPSVPGHAGDHGVGWRCYAASGDYPVAFYRQLAGSAGVVPSDRFVADAAAGTLPALCYLWHSAPDDEHPPADVTLGMAAIRRAVDAVVTSGGWDSTVFLLTWDDWGGWDDHVATPDVEHTPDGVQLAYGPRVPLLMFGGPVPPARSSRWCSHVSVPKTALDLLGLPPLGVPRVDADPGLADLVDAGHHQPPPPPTGTPVRLPAPPSPPLAPTAPPPPPPGGSRPVGPVLLRGGGTLPPPDDAPVRP